MPAPTHRSRPVRLRRLSGLLVPLVVVGIVMSVSASIAGSRIFDAPRQAVVSGKVVAAESVRAAPQPVVERVSLVPQRRVVESTTVRRPPPEPEPEQPSPRPAAQREEAEAIASAPFSFRVGTFNVLGSQHTGPGGDRHRYPAASVRTPAAARLIAKHGVDLLGTQELQADQLRGLQGRTGMAAYPGFAWGEAETDNSILWDPGVFELVSASKFTITFMGRPRPQPIVRLRHLATGQELYVVNTHPSAGGGRYVTERRNGEAALVAVVKDLKSEGLPVVVTGDMNDRAEFYCHVVPPAGLVAANGGSYAGGCRPPPEPMPVDWVVGSGMTWSGYWRDTTPVTQRTSDHFIVSASARIG